MAKKKFDYSAGAYLELFKPRWNNMLNGSKRTVYLAEPDEKWTIIAGAGGLYCTRKRQYWKAGTYTRLWFASNEQCKYRLMYAEYTNRNHQRHNESGYAVYNAKFPKVRYEYFINGVQVSKCVVLTPHKQRLKDILDEHDMERRRICIERYGWLPFLKAVDAEVVDTDVNPIENTKETLFKYCWLMPNLATATPYIDFKVMVCACPSTGRVYAIQVPDRVASCASGRKWLMGNRLKKAKLIGAS